MTKRRFWLATGVIVTIAILGLVARNQANMRRTLPAGAAIERRAYFEMLQPAVLTNCELERFGEPNDGGYLMCGNLLGRIQSGYSYGISGYDGWGCDIAGRFKVPVHQYDCFDTTEPKCPKGVTKFHAECVGDKKETVLPMQLGRLELQLHTQGTAPLPLRKLFGKERVFDTVTNQLAKNGDGSKRIAMKMDVEGAEWDSLLSAPDELLEQIDQMVVEFHGVGDERNGTQEQKLRVVERLKRFFEIGHIHYNNWSCADGLEPFPTWAYEVLFVSKQLAMVDPSRRAVGLHPLDAPNTLSTADCQPKGP